MLPSASGRPDQPIRNRWHLPPSCRSSALAHSVGSRSASKPLSVVVCQRAVVWPSAWTRAVVRDTCVAHVDRDALVAGVLRPEQPLVAVARLLVHADRPLLFFFNDAAPPEIFPLSLRDPLPI